MVNNLLNSTYIYKREVYCDGCERIIKIPVGVFNKNKQRKKFLINSDKNDDIDKQKLRTSISRTKRNIRRIALSNDFQYFATWTVSSEQADRFSVQSVEDKMKKLLKAYQRKYKDFKYLYICEKHENGALHFHGLVKCMPDLREYDINDFDKLPYYIIDTIEKGRKIYFSEFFNDNLGYNTFTKIKNISACGNYIMKYITKNPVINENDQVYFCSRDLIKCISEDYMSIYPEKYLDGGYEYTQDVINQETGEIEKKLFCKVKDIYVDTFNKNTKIDYIIDTLDRNNYI